MCVWLRNSNWTIFKLFFFIHLHTQNKQQQQKKAQETAALGKECEDSVEDAIDTVADKSESAWNRTKSAAHDAGETWDVFE